MKILAAIAGVFFAALLYLESQHIVNVNWDKLQTISNSNSRFWKTIPILHMYYLTLDNTEEKEKGNLKPEWSV